MKYIQQRTEERGKRGLHSVEQTTQASYNNLPCRNQARARSIACAGPDSVARS